MSERRTPTVRQRLGFAVVVALLTWALLVDPALFAAGLLVLLGLFLAALAYIAMRAQRIDRERDAAEQDATGRP